MKPLKFHTVDVFTDQPFAGNPLAIVEQADDLSDSQMQTLAREFNLPETIFIQRPASPLNTARVRIFLPLKEIPFAGHPTIGCAIFIAQKNYGESNEFEAEIKLEEEAGLVPVMVKRRSGEITAQLTAPVIPCPTKQLSSDSSVEFSIENAAAGYGLDTDDIVGIPSAHVGGPTFLFIQLKSREALSRARATEPLCTLLPGSYGGTGTYLYFLEPESQTIHARMFAPAGGIPEDPATGSASALLASELNSLGVLKSGENQYELRQGYDMGRPSQITLRINVQDEKLTRVLVTGTSVPIGSGSIVAPE